MKINISTTQAEAEALYRALDAGRRAAKTIVLPRQAFAHLLTDHGILCRALANGGHTVAVREEAPAC